MAMTNERLVEIDGFVSGRIENAQRVVVGDSGFFEGSIHTDILEIAGTVHGQVNTSLLLIRRHGQLVYDQLIYDHLELAPLGDLRPAGRTAIRVIRNYSQPQARPKQGPILPGMLTSLESY
jgi:hypothetical protein